MNLWQIIQGKQVDIYINLVFMLMGLVLGVIIDTLREDKSQEKFPRIQELKITVKQIENLTENHLSQNQQKSQNSSGVTLVYIYLTVFGLIYLFYRNEVLNSLLIFNSFLLSLWMGATLHSLRKNYFSGLQWNMYLLLVFIFSVGLFVISNKASVPNYAPPNLDKIQSIVLKSGISHLSDYFDLNGLMWFVIHILGVFLLFYIQIGMILSLVHHYVMGSYTLHYMDSEYVNNESIPWLAAKTYNYRNFGKNYLFTTIFALISYFCVSGDFFVWYVNGLPLPSSLNDFFNTIWNGASK
jgi:hypothetical protein